MDNCPTPATGGFGNYIPEVDEQHEIFTRIELLKVACVDGGYAGVRHR
jgi:hypothetical protein